MNIKPKRFKVDYEVVFVVSQEVSAADHAELSEKVLNVIKSNEGEIVNVEQWGLRKLAYPINGKHNGIYTLVEFRAFGELIERIERDFRYDERVIRFITIKLDKHAAAYNKKRREQGFGKKTEVTTEAE